MAPSETDGDNRPSKRRRGDVPEKMRALQYVRLILCEFKADHLEVFGA
jgi:hypothetical protein